MNRRGFLRMLGIGVAACVAGPVALKAMSRVKPEFDPQKCMGELQWVEMSREFYCRTIQADIYRRVFATNPFMELADGRARPFTEYTDELETDRIEVAHRGLNGRGE